MNRSTWKDLIPTIMVLVAILVLWSRVAIPGHALSINGSIEAFQHIWVGYMFCLCFGKYKKYAITILIMLSAFETYKFLSR